MVTWIASNHAKSEGVGAWHVGVPHHSYTERTRRLVGTVLKTRCNSKQLGGPWGYSRTTDPRHVESNECTRCKKLHEADVTDFRAKARAWFKATRLASKVSL